MSASLISRKPATQTAGKYYGGCWNDLGIPPNLLAVKHQFYDGMRGRTRMNDGTCSDWFDMGQGLRQGCILKQLVLNLFFAAMLMVAFEEFRKDEVMAEGN